MVVPPWKARCYAFRAFRPAATLALGGPLLGDPDRLHRTTASLARACCRAWSPTSRRPSIPIGHTSARSRVALRACMRARAAACLRPSVPLAAASRLPRPSASQPARRIRSQCQSPSRMPYRSMEPGTAGTSQPRLGTTWDDLRRPSRPLGSVAAASLSVPSRRSKPVRVGRFNGVSGRFETSQTSRRLMSTAEYAAFGSWSDPQLR